MGLKYGYMIDAAYGFGHGYGRTFIGRTRFMVPAIMKMMPRQARYKFSELALSSMDDRTLEEIRWSERRKGKGCKFTSNGK